MRWLRPSLAVAAAAFLIVATLAHGDYNVQDKGSYYSGAQGQRVNSTGDSRTDDVNFGAYEVFDNIIANQLGASGVALQDSSQALETWKFKRMALALTPQFDSLSTVVRVAIQVRGHFNNSVDSSSAFPWYPWPKRGPVGPTIVSAAIVVYASTNTVLHTAAAATSLGAFTHVPIGYLVIGPGIPVGTYVVSKGTSDSALTMSAAATATVAANQAITFAPPGSVIANQGGYQALQDSLGHLYSGSHVVAQQTIANAPFPTSLGAWPDEFVVKFNMSRSDSLADGGGKWGGYPKTIYLPLQSSEGAWFNAPYTSVRVRVLNGVRSRFRLHVKLVGMQ